MTVWMLSAALCVPASSFVSAAEPAPTAAAPVAAAYTLTDAIKAEIKSVLNENAGSETRIGVVVRLHNTSDRMRRVPDYELRMKTADGTSYTLRPSAANTTSIQSQEKVELSYLITVERTDNVALASLDWIEIDEFEYPQKEKTVLSIPVAGLQWTGEGAIPETALVKPWTEAFTLPVFSSSIEYTPVSLFYQNQPEGRVAFITLLAENKGKKKEAIPQLQIDGQADSGWFKGQKPIVPSDTLEPGAKQYVYFAISVDNEAELKRLVVLSPETFVHADKTTLDYTIGRTVIDLQDVDGKKHEVQKLQAYQPGSAIEFDPLSKLIRQGVEISLVELHMHGAEGDGYQTVVAKFKLRNKLESPIALPDFQAELRTADGFSYLGTRQSTVDQNLISNLGYVISYSFNVPSSEKGENLVMNLLDAKTAAPYYVPIASFQTKTQEQTNDDVMRFYPFNVKLADWTIAPLYNAGTYNYKMNMTLDISREDNIVVNQNFSKMKVELEDQLGRTLGSETLSFTGTKRLVSAKQSFTFSELYTDQIESGLVIKIYESIDTPLGEAKRLVKTLQQR
ncbi:MULTISPECIES: hypothetical protein [unclassified Paenibacillus]|uniref:hypothetical protein n=1 Tax=unclassified Paenibacillus TaxID=185978 RepID=UPI0009309D72|nr:MULTISPECIES: hypothetical protein [unclassified Paenibacillus]